MAYGCTWAGTGKLQNRLETHLTPLCWYLTWTCPFEQDKSSSAGPAQMDMDDGGADAPSEPQQKARKRSEDRGALHAPRSYPAKRKSSRSSVSDMDVQTTVRYGQVLLRVQRSFIRVIAPLDR